MSNKILFVFEGEVTEKQYFRMLKHQFVEDIIEVSYCNNIFDLFRKIKEDDLSSSVEILSVLKEIKCNEHLKKYNENNIAEIYLFFDLEPHIKEFTIEIINEMLDLFNNETENGKLYISYPMVESFKNIKEIGDLDNFINQKYDLNYKGRYKNYVNSNTDDVINGILSRRENQEYSNDQKNIIKNIIKYHCYKANHICNEILDFPKEFVTQDRICEEQYKLLCEENHIYVLSAFPLMLLEYFGCEKLEQKLQ